MNTGSPNPLAQRVRSAILSQFPDWEGSLEVREKGDIEIAIPAPSGSKAGSLVITTINGRDLWVRYSPPHMAYAVDDELELVEIVSQLVSEQASFAVIFEKEEWKGTTLLRPNERPELGLGQRAQIVSWLGTYDQEVDDTKARTWRRA
jgi:hypothetical protein